MKSPRYAIKSDFKLFAALVIVGLTTLLLVWAGFDYTFDDISRRESADAARGWVNFLHENISDFKRVLATGNFSPEEEALFNMAARVGKVVRYKIFDEKGWVIAASSEGDIGEIASNPQFAEQVMQGIPLSKMETHEDANGEIQTMGEAYQPVMDGKRFLGAVEVYVDMTGFVRRMQATRNSIFAAIALLFLLAGALIGYLNFRHDKDRTRQMNLIAGSERELRDSQQALLESENRLRTILENVGDAVIVISDKGKIELFNPAAELMFGYWAGEIQGKEIATIIPGAYKKNTAYDGAKFLAPKGTQQSLGKWKEILGQRKDGSTFHLEVTVGEMWIREKRFFTGVLYDVTQRMEAEKSLLSAKESAEAANRAKSDFLAMVSHEIRTPLNGVLGMTNLLLDSGLTQEQYNFTHAVHHSGEILLNILNDILDYSKMEAGMLELEKFDFQLDQLIESATRLIAPQAELKQIALAAWISPDLFEPLRGDPDRIRQVLFNLLGNAVKFTHQGGVLLEVSLEEVNDQWLTVKFTVSDTGIGIPEEIRQILFEKFTQADSSISRQYGGTGLGLAICKELVTLMGGGIDLTSEPGKGTTFWFTTPLEALPPEEGGASREALNVTGKKALLVLGDDPNRQALRNQLEGWGMEAVAADSMESVMEIIQAAHRDSQPFELLFLDQNMAGQDELRLMKQLNRKFWRSGLHQVLITPMSGYGDAKRARKLTHVTFLAKPIQPFALYNCLRSMFGAHETEKRPRGTAGEEELPMIPSKEPAAKPLRILVAEDNHVNGLLVSTWLDKLGHRADVVADGTEAVSAMQNGMYDLVLMDIQMPEMDGLEATARIRAMPGKKGQIPIIALTANTEKNDRELYLKKGMNDFIGKPFDWNAMLEVLNRWGKVQGVP